MTDRSVATVAASEAVAGIRGMSRLLELYKGSDLARLYEIQTKQKKRLIIGAQPLSGSYTNLYIASQFALR